MPSLLPPFTPLTPSERVMDRSQRDPRVRDQAGRDKLPVAVAMRLLLLSLKGREQNIFRCLGREREEEGPGGRESFERVRGREPESEGAREGGRPSPESVRQPPSAAALPPEPGRSFRNTSALFLRGARPELVVDHALSSVFSRTKSLSQKSFSASFDTDDQHRPSALLVRRYSISAAATATATPPSQLPLASKIQSGFEPRKSLSTSASFDANDQHRPSAPSSGGTRSPPLPPPPPPPPRRPCSSRWPPRSRAASSRGSRRRPPPPSTPTTSTGRGPPRPAVLDLRRRRLLAALAAPAGLQGPERLRAAEVVVDLRLLRRRRPAPAEHPLVRRYSISAAAAASSPPSQLRWRPRSSVSRTMSSLRGRITWS
ncbi:formin-like protein 16 [Eucalyptus grandis]|uniref:formin-like protein 16 n=1 Tax=Eucalyptus grandis TaxID=71139 RepID=UPI00192EDBDB|nr:formin-like protein 16 [Eucalyptus grandis]